MIPQSSNPEQQPPPSPPSTPDLRDWTRLFDVLFERRDQIIAGNIAGLQAAVAGTLLTVVAERGSAAAYNVICLLQDEGAAISRTTRDRIYAGLSKLDNSQPVLLVLASSGGEIAPAYLISKFCKEFSGRFEVCVPRQAKSAATLISLGADRIHMGNISELG